jgi:hypothetical protein
MPPITGSRVSSDLTDYYAVLAADIKDFTGNTDTDNRMLARRLPQVLCEAFARSGLDFSDVRFPGQAGDGYAAGIDYHKLPHLISPLLDRLQDVLAELDAEIGGQGPRMRLRVSINIGHLPGDADAHGPAGIGRAMNDLHRLLDADAVRDALSHTDPDTTFVAAVISQRAYEDAIRSGACGMPPSMLIPIPVHVKQFTSKAWLYVPEPSGTALYRAFTRNLATHSSPSSNDHSAADPGFSLGTPFPDIPAPTFHIGNAGQVAGTVTAPVTVRQMFHCGDLTPNTTMQAGAADSPAAPLSSIGEFS